jgi:HSP20 family protein
MAKQSQSKRDVEKSSTSHETPDQRSRQGGERSDIARRESHLPTNFGSPLSLMRRFGEEMNRLFEDFGLRQGFWPDLGREFGRLTNYQGSPWSPQVEVFERDDQLVVRADLPGMRKDDVDVEITDDAIVIKGERTQEYEGREEGFYRSERSYGKFYRSIPLPEGIDPEEANATFRDGVLEITMPAPERSQKRRRLEVREASTGGETQRRAKAAGS